MTARRVLDESSAEWLGEIVPVDQPEPREAPRRALAAPTLWQRFLIWYGWRQPGFNGGTVTGLIVAIIIQTLILFGMWSWLNV